MSHIFINTTQATGMSLNRAVSIVVSCGVACLVAIVALDMSSTFFSAGVVWVMAMLIAAIGLLICLAVILSFAVGLLPETINTVLTPDKIALAITTAENVSRRPQQQPPPMRRPVRRPVSMTQLQPDVDTRPEADDLRADDPTVQELTKRIQQITQPEPASPNADAWNQYENGNKGVSHV